MSALARLMDPYNQGSWFQHPFVTYIARGAPVTQQQRRYKGEQLASWLSNGMHNALTYPWHDLKYEHLVTLRAGLVQRYAPGTVNQYLVIVKGILKECWRLGFIDSEEFRRVVDVPSVTNDKPQAGRDVQMEELKVLLRTLEQEGSLIAVRDIAIFATLYGTGMRRAELCKLRLEDYDPHDVSFYVQGKGSRDRISFAPTGVREHLAAWLNIRGDSPGALFVRMDRGRVDGDYSHINPKGLHRMVQRRTKQAGFPHTTTHDFRRTVIGDLCDAGVDLVTIGKNTGQTPATVARYDRRGKRTRQAAVNRLPFSF